MVTKPDLSGTAFGDVDRTGHAAAFISYLDRAQVEFSSVKRTSYALLRLRPGEKVLDVGCGIGEDLLEMSTTVGPQGLAAGLDKSESMIAEARRRTRPPGTSVQFEVGDAEHLPWNCSFFDACRADRLLQHVADPERGLNEMLRVQKPLGRLVITDRDWGLVGLDSSDGDVTPLVLDRAAAGIRNPWMGRILYGLFRRAGLNEIQVQTHCIDLHSFESADALLDLCTVAEHVVEEGKLSRLAVDKWLEDLRIRDQLGSFFATVTLISVFGVKP